MRTHVSREKLLRLTVAAETLGLRVGLSAELADRRGRHAERRSSHHRPKRSWLQLQGLHARHEKDDELPRTHKGQFESHASRARVSRGVLRAHLEHRP